MDGKRWVLIAAAMFAAGLSHAPNAAAASETNCSMAFEFLETGIVKVNFTVQTPPQAQPRFVYSHFKLDLGGFLSTKNSAFSPNGVVLWGLAPADPSGKAAIGAIVAGGQATGRFEFATNNVRSRIGSRVLFFFPSSSTLGPSPTSFGTQIEYCPINTADLHFGHHWADDITRIEGDVRRRDSLRNWTWARRDGDSFILELVQGRVADRFREAIVAGIGGFGSGLVVVIAIAGLLSSNRSRWIVQYGVAVFACVAAGGLHLMGVLESLQVVAAGIGVIVGLLVPWPMASIFSPVPNPPVAGRA